MAKCEYCGKEIKATREFSGCYVTLAGMKLHAECFEEHFGDEYIKDLDEEE